MDTADPGTASAEGPRLSVLAVVTRASAAGSEVLLVRRANPPQAGHWGFPGGKVEWGEDLDRAAIRELREETGIRAGTSRPFEIVELIEEGYHDLMIAVRLAWQAGEPRPGDDALEARWISLAVLPEPLCDDVARVIAAALPARY